MFHRTLDADRFSQQLDVLLEGRNAVSGFQVVAALDGGPSLPASPVWLTFDDAYGDFVELAMPVIRRRQLPVTQFVATAYVGAGPASFWWERLQAGFQESPVTDAIRLQTPEGEHVFPMDGQAARGRSLRHARQLIKGKMHGAGMAAVEEILTLLRVDDVRSNARGLTWEEIKDLQAEGVEFGGHTHSHPMLDRVDPREAHDEVRRGFEELRAQLSTVLPAFAYPSGQYNKDVLKAVVTAGVCTAVTTETGIFRPSRDRRLEIQRLPIGPHADASAVRVRLALARLRRL